MKKIILSILFLIFQLLSFGQEERKEINQTPVVKEDEKEDSELTFDYIEEVPIFPGCEGVEINKRINCFQAKMQEHIKKNLIYPKQAMNKNIQGRVTVMFIINKEGKLENIIAKGSSNCEDCEILEREAIRIIRKLPRMTPGKQKGKAVKVKYSQPFTFKLQ